MVVAYLPVLSFKHVFTLPKTSVRFFDILCEIIALFGQKLVFSNFFGQMHLSSTIEDSFLKYIHVFC